MSQPTLKCCSCKEEKPVSEFYADKYRKSGYRSSCKKCGSDKRKIHYEENKEAENAKTYAWRNENREYYLSYQKHLHGTNPDFINKEKEISRNREEAREYGRTKTNERNAARKEEVKIWRNENREDLNAKQRARVNRRRKEDPIYKISCNLRDRFKKVAEYQSAERLMEYDELFGCTVEFFKQWIESHWLEGMTWENWGIGENKWNLDHHYPLAAFDLIDPEQQRAASHYTNIYPMWAKDNLAKKDSIPSVPRENLYIPDFVKNHSDS